MDDQERLDRIGENSPPPADRLTEGEPVPPHIKEVTGLPEGERDVVQEYEDRYYGTSRTRLEAPPDADSGAWEPPGRVVVPAKHKREFVGENERKWAALAHASTLLTALAMIFTAGLGTLIIMFVPLLIYFSFRKRSEYVAFQALQAFTAQLVGTIGWLALLIVTFIACVLVTVVLAITIVGIPFILLLWLGFVLFVVASLALPLGMVIYSVIAAIETWGGHDYRKIPYVSRWVENQLNGGSFIDF